MDLHMLNIVDLSLSMLVALGIHAKFLGRPHPKLKAPSVTATEPYQGNRTWRWRHAYAH